LTYLDEESKNEWLLNKQSWQSFMSASYEDWLATLANESSLVDISLDEILGSDDLWLLVVTQKIKDVAS